MTNTQKLATIHSLPRFAELFAGIGLVRKGLEQCGWQCVFANEINKVKGELYARNFGDEHLLLDDVANVHAGDIPDVMLITASFPCQDLSLAGNREGLAGERSGTFFEFTRILAELVVEGRAPQVVLLENVVGLLTSHDGNDIRKVLLSLNQLGYSCDLLVIDAVHFVPQSRPRIFVVGQHHSPQSGRPAHGGGSTSEQGKTRGMLFGHSNTYFSHHPCRPAMVHKVIATNTDISWSFLDLPPLPASRRVVLSDLIETNNCHKWFDKIELARELSYIRHSSKNRLERAKELARLTRRTIYLTAYRRMRKGLVCLETRDDGVAGCLRTPVGGSSRQVLIAVSADSVQMRYMTAREYGRLQGVGDSFWIPENQNVGLRAFGDAVAVPVVDWIGRVLKTLLSNQPVVSGHAG